METKNLDLTVDVHINNLSIAFDVPMSDVNNYGYVVNSAKLIAGAATLGTYKYLLNDASKVKITSLEVKSGDFFAGTSTLIISAPGGGKSAFLRAISGREKTTNGSITYNGLSSSELASRNLDLRKLANYAFQSDLHEPLLTVEDTLLFIANCYASPGAKLEDIKKKVDDVIDVLGLSECRSTIVGNSQIRGISGGQLKRVTIAESILSNARILCLDEITNGLDSSTAFLICKYLVEKWAKETNGTLITALQSPTPEIVSLFDSTILLSESKVLFWGKTSELKSYLFSRGFACPSYMDVADFAVTVATSPSLSAELFADEAKEAGAPPVTCLNVEQLSGAWYDQKDSSIVFVSRASTRVNVESMNGSIHPELARGFSKSFFAFFGLLLARQSKMFFRNKGLILAKIMPSIVMGFIIGSLYYNIPSTSFNLFTALAQFCLVFLSFSNNAEIPIASNTKKVLFRHLESNAYPALPFVASIMTTSLPVAAIGDLIFSAIVYWLAGWANDAGRFFAFWGILLAHDLAISALFRLYAFVTPSPELAQAAAGSSTGILLVVGGFLLPYASIPPWFWPLYWISPFSWSIRSLFDNQFLSNVYNPAVAQQYANVLGFKLTYGWLVAGPCVMIGYYLLFGLIISPIVLKLIFSTSEPGTRISKEVIVSSTKEVKKSLNFTPVTMTFTNITYDIFIPATKTYRRLLSDVTGYFKPGTMTALMGASGAGKSTLMDVLAFRKNQGKIGGDILLNGYPISKQEFARVAAYVEQSDQLSIFQTVREAIIFSAKLRLEADVSHEQMMHHVEDLIDSLDLIQFQNRLISTLSQSERKRVNVAIELASNPSLVFLDEPTTGLDARSAILVIRAIKRVADSGRTVICTIHQPSAQIFFAFDHLLLLAPGGHMLYAGELGKRAKQLEAFLGTIPGVAPLEANTNPASWMVETTNPAKGPVDMDSRKVIDELKESVINVPMESPKPRFAKFYATSDLAKNNESTTKQLAQEGAGSGAAKISFKHAHASGVLLQFSEIFKRQFMSSWRNPELQPIRLLIGLIVSLYFGLFYLNISISTQSGVFGALAFIMSSAGFIAVVVLLSSFPMLFESRNVYYREKVAGYYLPIAYSMGLFLAELPWIALLTFILSPISYFMAGTSTSSKPPT
jgi:ABC-type multidrug transport system ATPase subunit/ABC-type multidrug transport system permease subunit